MAKAPAKRAAPGYQPGLGMPDPNDPANEPTPKATVTHYADGSRNGPVCGIRPTPSDASAYDPTDPSCPACLDWLTKTRAHTEKVHGATIAQNRAAAAAATRVSSAGARRSSAPEAPTLKDPPAPPAGPSDTKAS